MAGVASGSSTAAASDLGSLRPVLRGRGGRSLQTRRARRRGTSARRRPLRPRRASRPDRRSDAQFPRDQARRRPGGIVCSGSAVRGDGQDPGVSGVPPCGARIHMLRAAIADPDPTVLIEHRLLYQATGSVITGGKVQLAGGARQHRSGRHVAIITRGALLPEVIAAADRLAEEGIEAAVLDLRWLRPLDDDAIARVTVESSGRVLVSHEACTTGGFGAEIAARIQKRHFAILKEPHDGSEHSTYECRQRPTSSEQRCPRLIRSQRPPDR